ncbi:hypothetical protein CC2G_003484 [Coprinopsis cinerea AmutBmut pab1-1]|nr:hypothetical protein CC2G_003484 [Coprinopsis cinerea AmutBmut pab1-1]
MDDDMDLALHCPQDDAFSKLEVVLLTCTENNLAFLDIFFGDWPILSIIRLGLCNLTLYTLVRGYLDRTWNVLDFLGRWFREPDRALKMMDDAQASAYGANVLRFFLRGVDETEPLDLCVPVHQVYRVATVILMDGFDFVDFSGSNASSFTRALEVAFSAGNSTRDSRSGERSLSASSLSAMMFLFRRTTAYPCGTSVIHEITLHLVTCEPHRYILSQHSTALMCHITSQGAVCPFALATLATFRSFAVGDEANKASGFMKQEGRYQLYSSGTVIANYEMVSGRSGRSQTYLEVVNGRRFMGDRHCWFIPASIGVMEDVGQYHGPTFEVFDVRSGVVEGEAYLRIGEPFILSNRDEVGGLECPGYD